MKIDIFSTASFDVDAQKGFTPICPNELPVPDGDNIVDELNAQARFARIRVGSKDAHPHNAWWKAEKTNEIATPIPKASPNIDLFWPMHCESGTFGMELLHGLPAPEAYNYFVWKGIEPHLHPYGAAYHDLHDKLSTGVIEYLKANYITTVLVAGLALEYCVKTTALQLHNAGFHVIVNLGACRAITKENALKTLADFQTTAGHYNIRTIQSASELEINNKFA